MSRFHPHDDMKLREHHKKKTVAELADMLGRSEQSVYVRLRKLGLGRRTSGEKVRLNIMISKENHGYLRQLASYQRTSVAKCVDYAVDEMRRAKFGIQGVSVRSLQEEVQD